MYCGTSPPVKIYWIDRLRRMTEYHLPDRLECHWVGSIAFFHIFSSSQVFKIGLFAFFLVGNLNIMYLCFSSWIGLVWYLETTIEVPS